MRLRPTSSTLTDTPFPYTTLFRSGEDDAAQDRALARAVDARCLQHLVGDRQAILADEEDAEDAREPRHQRAGIAVDQPHRLQLQEQDRKSTRLNSSH